MATLAEALILAFDLVSAGRWDEARELAARIRDAVPDHADALHLAGLAELGDGDRAAAWPLLRSAAVLAPHRVDIAHNFARAALDADAEPAAVLAALRRAALLAPHDAEWPARAAAWAEKRQDWPVAAAMARRLTALQPDLADAWRRLGAALGAMGDWPGALAAWRRAARLFPADACRWGGVATAARRADDQPAAISAFRRALTLEPDRAETWSTLGNALRDAGLIEESCQAHDRAARLSGNDPTIVWNQALALLTAGRWAEGWPALESRWRAKGFPTAPRRFEAPPWRGEPLAGKSILLYEEQGRGDAIQFARFIPVIAAMGATTTVEVGGDLVALFRHSFAGLATVIETGAPLPPTDFVCPLMSLPLALGATPERIPGAVPYLFADPAKAAALRPLLKSDAPLKNDALNVGIVWAGNPAFADDRRRSPGHAPLAPLFTVPGVCWFGLRAGSAPYPNYVDLGPEVIADFSDTAAVMAGLDLVICSCTAAAHLAGAVGRPVWVMLAKAADWRWLAGRDDSPWHPTARLFRQTQAGDWDDVAARVAAALARAVEVKRSEHT